MPVQSQPAFDSLNTTVLITFTLILQMEASVELHVVHGQCFACLCPYPEYCMVIIAVAIDILQGNLRLADHLKTAHIRAQHVRHDHAAVCLLVVFEDGNNRARQR